MEWDAQAFMYIAIGVFFLLFGIGLFLALLRLSTTLQRTTSILTDVNTEVIPMLQRVETTLDGVNSELGKIDEITGSVATIAKHAEDTATAVRGAVTTPVKKVAGAGAAVSEAVGTFLFGRGKEA
jgi:uncharacterized protein YoxC